MSIKLQLSHSSNYALNSNELLTLCVLSGIQSLDTSSYNHSFKSISQLYEILHITMVGSSEYSL